MEDSGSKACPWGAGASREAQPPPGSCLRQSKSGEEYPGSPFLSQALSARLAHTGPGTVSLHHSAFLCLRIEQGTVVHGSKENKHNPRKPCGS